METNNLSWIERRRKIQDLIMEIRHNLPSRRMMEVVSVGAINYKGKTIILKSRYEDRDLPVMLLQNIPIEYNTLISDMDYPYYELLTKNVVFDTGLLRRRGIEALEEIIKLTYDTMITKYSC